jgi:hypothetical protein
VRGVRRQAVDEVMVGEGKAPTATAPKGWGCCFHELTMVKCMKRIWLALR